MVNCSFFFFSTCYCHASLFSSIEFVLGDGNESFKLLWWLRLGYLVDIYRLLEIETLGVKACLLYDKENYYAS